MTTCKICLLGYNLYSKYSSISILFLNILIVTRITCIKIYLLEMKLKEYCNI